MKEQKEKTKGAEDAVEVKPAREKLPPVDKDSDFNVFEVSVEGKKIQKRFRVGRDPKAVVATTRLTGELHILCWTTNTKAAEGHVNRVKSKFIDKDDRYTKVWIIPEKDIKHVRVMTKDDEGIPAEFLEDRGWVRERRREERIQAMITSGKTREEAEALVSVRKKTTKEPKAKTDKTDKTKAKVLKTKVPAEGVGADAFTSKKKAMSAAKAVGLTSKDVMKQNDGKWVVKVS